MAEALGGGKGGKKRLLVVSQHFWPENFRVNDMVSGFAARGVEVDVLCGLPNYPAGEWFPGYRYTGPRRQEYGGAQVFRAGEIRRKGNTSLRIFLNYCSFPLFALFSLPRLARRRYDAVLCYETSPVLMLLPAIVYAKTHRVPLCGYVLDLWPDNLYSVLPVRSGLLRRLAQAVSNWHYRRCDKLIALSDAGAARLREVTKAAKRPPPVTVLPQYAEDFYAEALPAPDALRQKFAGRFTLLFAGNLSPAQDLENLVRAVQLVRAEAGGEALKVLLLGDGMSREALSAEIKARGLSEAFEFCGSVPPREVPRWTALANALFAGLAPSENLGLTMPAKVSSYLAAARPILAAMDGEGARVVQEAGAGLVSPAGDSAALAQNILALMRMSGARRTALGEAARARYLRDYRRGALLDRLLSFILHG